MRGARVFIKELGTTVGSVGAWDRDRFGTNIDHVQTVVGISGLVDVPALQRAADRVLQAHPQLLRGFGYDAVGRPISVSACETPRLREVDLRECSAFERDEAALRLVEHERCEEFPLGAPPLIRLLLVRVGEREQRLAVTGHRLLLDRWSQAALVRDLFEVYGGASREPAWLARTVPDDGAGWSVPCGADRAAAVRAWQREFEDGIGGGSAEGGASAAWLGRGLGGVPSGADSRQLSSELTVELSSELTRRILWRAAEWGIDADTVVQGVWAVTSSRLTGRQDVVFGVVGTPREFLPMAVRVRPGQSVIEVMRAIQARGARLRPHWHLGLAEVLKAVGPRAWFETVAALGPEPVGPSSPRLGLRISTLGTYAANPYALSCSVVPGPAWTVRLDYRPEALGTETPRAVMASVVELLEDLAGDPSRPVGRAGHVLGVPVAAQLV
jgi:nonribosomal peptide synthetase CepB